MLFLVCSLVLVIVQTTVAQEYTVDQLKIYEEFLKNQKKLVDNLFRDYDPTISGIYTLRSSAFINQTGYDHPPLLELSIQCIRLKLVDVSEKEEKVTFLFDYLVIWKDVRLKWNPEDYGGISHIYVPQKKLWIPEITITDVHDVLDFKTEDQKDSWIHHNGSVGFYGTVVPSVICHLDVFKFPMDTHICSVNIMYNTYYVNEFKMINEPVALVDRIDELGNGEWRVEWVNSTTEHISDDVADVLQTMAKIRRNPGFYISLVIIPAFFINALSLIALFIDINTMSEKFGIGLTNIMAMTFILSILADDLPKTQRIPRLAIYVIVSLVIIVVAIFSLYLLKYLRRLEFFKSRRHLKIEYILMLLFQIANFVNFIILFC